MKRSPPPHRFVGVGPEREPERSEVFERIPWEMLEPKRNDRQWWVMGLAGAAVLGVLAYSLAGGGSGPVGQPVADTVAQVAAPVPTPAATAAPPPPPPVVTAEADLYAVDPERVIDRAAAHAEWFVAEYLTVDGSEESSSVLAAMLPAGVPLPEVAEATRVFVEWVRALQVEETGDLRYRVTVLARTLVARGEEPYARQAPLQVTVELALAQGEPTVVEPPFLGLAPLGSPSPLALVEVPPDKSQAAVAQVGAGEVLGGTRQGDGAWRVVVMAPGPDGVVRPQTVLVP